MFGTLAIGTIMLSLAFDLALALHAGAIGMLIMVQVLIFKALTVQRQNPKQTEVWQHLDVDARPVGAPGAAVFASVLKDVYAFFARNAFTLACWFFGVSMLLRILRTGG